MIEVQDWLAPLIGSLFVFAVPFTVALMCNTIIRRLRSNDAHTHERRLNRKELPNRKEDERNRLKTMEQWAKISSYTRARNLCLLIALAVLEVNVGAVVLALTGQSPVLSLSLLAVLAVCFAAGVRWALKKPALPVWATTIGYYRDLAVNNGSREGSA